MTKKVIIPCDVNSRYAQHLIFNMVRIPEYCYIRKNERQVNAKSILGIFSLDLHKGDEVEFVVNCDRDIDAEAVFAPDDQKE